MTWFKVDDGLHASVKARRAGDAMALWVMAGSWCADQLTDGWLPEDIAEVLAPRSWRKWSARLVEVRLWVPEQREGHPGWRFHDWQNYQPSKAQVVAEREAAAERQRRARDRARESRRDGGSSSRVSHAVTDAVTTPVSHGPPDPTRPDPTNKNNTSPPPVAVGSDQDSDFVAFWSAYPRKVGKPSGRKAWRSAVVKRKADPAVIIKAAEALRDDPSRRGRPLEYTPHPSTWLNDERYNDQPAPRQQPIGGWWDN